MPQQPGQSMLAFQGDGLIFLQSFSSGDPGEVAEAGTIMSRGLTPDEDTVAQKG